MAQRPGATLVQTEKAWKKKGYAVKPEASPIVIMQVGGPVTLVYDREDVCSTEPQLEAVRDYINEKLITALREALEKCRDRKKILLDLGKSYVLFFYGNPLYYQFLFTRGSIDINTNEPFLFFSGVASQALGVMHDDKLSKKTLRKKTIALWAMVQGLAQIAMMKGALDESRLDAEIVSILCSVEV